MHVPEGFRFCDSRGSQEIGRLKGKFLALAIAAHGRLAATCEKDRSLTLRDGRTFEPIRTLEPAASLGTLLMRRGLGISFSTDGRRTAWRNMASRTTTRSAAQPYSARRIAGARACRRSDRCWSRRGRTGSS
jgi:hypothetical protein